MIKNVLVKLNVLGLILGRGRDKEIIDMIQITTSNGTQMILRIDNLIFLESLGNKTIIFLEGVSEKK